MVSSSRAFFNGPWHDAQIYKDTKLLYFLTETICTLCLSLETHHSTHYLFLRVWFSAVCLAYSSVHGFRFLNTRSALIGWHKEVRDNDETCHYEVLMNNARARNCQDSSYLINYRLQTPWRALAHLYYRSLGQEQKSFPCVDNWQFERCNHLKIIQRKCSLRPH